MKVIEKDKPKEDIFKAAVKEFYKDNPDVDKAIIDIRPYKVTRSTAQNSLLHLWIGLIAQELGYTNDAMKTILVEKFLGYEQVKTKSDKVIKTLRSTSKLKVDEFAQFLTDIDMFMAEWQFTLPHPDDLYYTAMGYKR